MAFKEEEVRGGKLQKQRITVLVGGNLSGQKLPLLVIWHAKQPRCFPKDHTKIALAYRSNGKAWMTSSLFQKWLEALNSRLEQEGCNIDLILDNCPAHPHIELQHIKSIFLPPNTTAKTQPMDSGIIRNMKHNYRTLLARKFLAALEDSILTC